MQYIHKQCNDFTKLSTLMFHFNDAISFPINVFPKQIVSDVSIHML